MYHHKQKTEFYPFTNIELTLYQTNTNNTLKKRGCTAEYERERNAELLGMFRDAFSKYGGHRLDSIWEAMSTMPASRFWVSEDRAAIVISRIMAGDDLSSMQPIKREMFSEIHRRVVHEKLHNGKMSVRELCAIVINQPAPKLYLKPSSIRVIIYKIRSGWYKRKYSKLIQTSCR